MKKQGTGIREQGSGRIEQLLREAVPPYGDRVEESRDLWPTMHQRLRTEAAAKAPRIRVPWFDLALAGGLVLLLFAFPAWIPVLLYYL
jgi:hypothetical protein